MTISSFSPPRDESFDGYAFVGADFVAGPDGFASFRGTGRAIGPGLDGCYALTRRTEAGWESGTDARGLRKLFLFRRGDIWALSTSLHELAAHLRAHGVTLRPDLTVLRAFGVRQALTAQLNSSRTLFQDVTLVPSFCTVRIEADGPRIVASDRDSDVPGYEEALGTHLHTWRSRFATLVADDRTTFVADLSGGLDSRVVFAFAHASGLFEHARTRAQIASQERMPEDFIAASAVARQYGVELNGPPMPMRTPTSPDQALENWKRHSLGVYMPVYLSPHAFDALSIRCHGAGGGTFRDIFTGTTLRNRLLSTRKNFAEETFEEYSAEVLGDLESLCRMRPEVDPQKLHYREFRNRFHFGHAPQSRTTFSPLNSILIDPIADRPEADDRRTYFDMMDSLVPGLKNAPYDDSAKAPKSPAPSALSARLARVRPEPGLVFAQHRPGPVEKRHQRTAFSHFYELAERSLERSDVQDAIGDARVIRRTRTFLREVRAQSGRPRANAPGHQDAAYALTAALAVGAPLDP
ncbi:hypothetical protein [Brachybacterium sacelli]|uniref:Asparagine synthetase domain-containing protein n=1 Tax=Brachybacterium sacelli TaxID=173364 RepID=A0ABS4WVH9_9MICO|nr:hypothetical protein [Brachybacterium sacelli]MBP2380207.1 hypothetical protein [Brachybacterium sacelli]